MFGFNEPKVPQVTPEIVKEAIEKNEKCVILDVRTEGEYFRGKLAKSINVSVEKVGGQILSVIPDKSAKIYVYCLSGSRSVVAVDTMIKLGYTNVFDMKQGLLAWRAKYFPVEA